MLEIKEIIGASFTGLTVRTNIVVSVNSPSDTIVVISVVPFQSKTGDAVMVRFSESAETKTELVSEKTLSSNVSPVSISVTSKEKTSISSSITT